METMTYTTSADEFTTGFRGEISRLQTRVRALKIAEGLIAQGWKVSIADEAISTSSIYFNALSPENRCARSSKIEAVIAAVIRRAA